MRFEHAQGISDRRQSFRKGELLYRQDDLAEGWLEMVSGTVRLCHYYGDGRRQVLAFPVSGDVLGLDSGFRLCSAEALTNGEAIWHYSEKRRSPANEGDTVPEWHTALERALRSAEENLRFFSYPTAIQRLCAFLLDFHRRQGHPARLDLPMSRLDIAEHLGLTMHTISRSISQLARNGLIECTSPQRVILGNRMRIVEFAGIEDDELVAQTLSLVA
jgi:CRP-like cAMP-binding protein